MAILKANAYGHGDEAIFRHLLKQNIQYFGVARLNEALKLRALSAQAKILILSPIDPKDFRPSIEKDLTLTITNPNDAQTIVGISKKSNSIAKVHIKIDTGMHRTGCLPYEAIPILKILKQPTIFTDGIFTHFADADNTNLQFSQFQLKVFNSTLNKIKTAGLLPPVIHAANSSATINLPESHFNLVRIGLGLHGLNPFHPHVNPIELKPTLSLHTSITRIQELKTGETVGYGRTYRAKTPLLVATIAAGYGDGIRRAPQNWPYVSINDQLAPVIGRVSMDQITVDITKINPIPELHQEVLLISDFSNHPCSAEVLADKVDTSNYELVTSLQDRVERIYI